MSETDPSTVDNEDHEEHGDHADLHEPGLYEIRIRGHLGGRWATWFEGMTFKMENNGDTVLTGEVVDQAALHGLLRKVRDLGMPLLSVTSIRPHQADP
ncbi:MAG: hypothetical protein ABI670_06870 [Chloroflexota bacterium]